jgi:lysophospholipid acyltransferase (LPLAT)-like uncharacterized protein
MKRIKYTLLLHLFPPLVYLFMRLLYTTLRVEHLNREAQLRIWREGGNAIFCFWHGRLFMMPYAEERKRCKVLVSTSRDGEFISRVVRFFGIGTIRGSYRKASFGSIREIMQSLEQGYDIAVTPDGPKGPRYRVKKGIVEIARLSGRPLVPVSFSATKKKLFIPGTDSSCRCPSQGWCSCGASPYTYQERQAGTG